MLSLGVAPAAFVTCMNASISSPIKDTAGLPYKTIDSLKGVVQLDLLDKDNALVIVRTPSGSLNLETVPLP